MPSLPMLDIKTSINHSPHVVILGAGASIACTIRNPEKSGKKLPGMPDLVEVLGLESLIESHGVTYEGQNFEAFYDGLSKSGEHPELLGEIETEVYNYFAGMELPDEATIYDYLILSLREKDIIATFNWDPFLAQAYVRNMNVIGHEHMPKIVFLHGNVFVGACMACKTCGWSMNRCSQCGKRFEPSKLLYPVGKKDYSSDAFIKEQWDIVRAHIKHAYYISVFGYSAPVTDAEARHLMLSVWEDNATRELAEIDLIDIRAKDDRKGLEKNWENFTVSHHYACYDNFFNSYLCRHPRRSCDAFAMASLQCAPWHDNFIPADISPSELHQWLQPLIEAEKREAFTGEPFREKGRSA